MANGEGSPKMPDDGMRQKEIRRHRLERAARGPSDVVERFVAEYQDELHDGDQVLEVGVGEGRNLKPFADLGKNLRLHGIDDKQNAVELCRQLLAKQEIDAKIVRGSFADLPYADNSMNVIVSHAALQNAKTFEEARGAFAEIARVLMPSGLYLFRENRTPRLKDADRTARVAYFTEDEVRKLAEDNGFIIERGEKPVEGESDTDRASGKRVTWEVVFRKQVNK
ncbi:class I SAM-dependent methyltransferase [Candidatus Uhrbacteria bacterium]|nr:class I SAM-dependent methyltransferase [Candidatus Uhrbacteria bacterium]